MSTAPGRKRSMPGWRHTAAAGSLLAYVAIAAADGGIVVWLLLPLVVAAAVAMRRRTVLAQVLSQGVAWFCLLEPGVRLARHILGVSGIIEPYGALSAASLAAGVSLALARPALHTADARSAFAPVGYRTWFLAGAIASVVAAMTGANLALTALFWGSHWAPVCIAVTLGFIASAIGVVRMRAWGVLLGGATALAATIATLVSDSYEATAVVLALGATPGVVLGLPLLAARLGRGSPLPSRVRAPAPLPGKRVSDSPRAADEILDDDSNAEEAPAARAARPESR